MNVFKKVFTTITAVATIAWSVGLVAFVPVAHAAVTSGSLIKASGAAVYYYGADNKRYVFPNEATYKTWYANFSSVMTITDAELAAIQIGGNVTFRPGVKLGKITTDPKVYAIGANGQLRWIKTEAVAIALYGANWGALVTDIPDAFFTNYTYGPDINSASDFNPASVTSAASSINVDKNLGSSAPVVGTGGALTVALASDSPAGQSVPAGATPATNVNFAKVNLTAGANAVIINKLTVTRSGLSADGDISAVKLMDGATQLDTAQTLNSSHQATFNVNKTIAAGTTWSVVIAGDLAASNTASSEMKFGIAANTDVNSNASSVSGAPVFGNTMVLTNISVGSLTIARGAQAPIDADGAAAWDTKYDIGDDKVVFAVKLTAGSVEDVKVSSIMLESGDNSTIQTGDISNIRLINDTTGQTIATLAALDSKGNAVFDLSANPLVLSKGVSRDLIVKAKVENGASRVIAFDLNDGSSWLVRATGATYGFGVAYESTDDWNGTKAGNGSGIGNGIEINQGTLTVSKAATSPAAGNIGKGVTDAILGDYAFEAKGEDIRIGTTVVDINLTAAAPDVTKKCSYYVDNVKLVDAKTGVVLAGPVSPKIGGPSADNVMAGGANVCVATFSSSFELPNGANTVRVMANTTSSIAAGDTILAEVKGASFANVKGLTSNKTITPSPASDIPANLMTVKGATLVAQVGTSPIAANVVKGKVNFIVGYVGLDSSSGGEDVRVSQINLTHNGGATMTNVADSTDFVNARLINVATGAQVGQTVQPVDADGTPDGNSNINFTFSGDELVVSKTQQVNLAVQVDILSNVTADEDFGFTIASVSGTGKASATAAATSTSGTSPTQNAKDSGKLKVTVDANTAVGAQLVAGSTSNSVVSYKMEAVDEDINVTDIYLGVTKPSSSAVNGATTFGADFASVDIYVNGVKVGSNLSGTNNGVALLSVAGGTIIVPKDGSLILTVKANVNTKSNVTSNTDYKFGIADADATLASGIPTGAAIATDWDGVADSGYFITATGKDSGTSIVKTDINSTGVTAGKLGAGKVMSVHDGILTVTLNASSPSGAKNVSANQELLRVTLTATGDEITVNEIELTVSETCTLGGGALVNAAVKDVNDTSASGIYVTTDVIATLIPGDEGGETALVVSPAAPKTIKFEGDTQTICDPTLDQSIQLSIAAAGSTQAGVNYQAVDGIDVGVTATLPQAKELPITGNSISF